MKNTCLILLLAFSLNAIGQKNYKIIETTWSYASPDGYIVRIDNFEQQIKTGQEYIKNKDDGNTISNDDKILLSIAKTDSLQMNMLFVSHKNNENIKRFTAKGYAERLGDYFKENPKNDNPNVNVSVTVSPLSIDSVEFYLIRKKVDYKEKNITYASDYYFANIDNRELSIVAIYDNDSDKAIIEQSILESRFE